MADHTVSDFTIQNPQFQVARMRRLQENIALFGSALSANAGRAPAIDLRNRRITGHYETTSQFKLPANTISRRDPTADSTLTPSKIQDELHVGIKINSTIGPYRDSIDKFLKRGDSAGAQSMVIGQATADYQFQDYTTTGLSATIAALLGMSGTPLVLNNYTSKLTQADLIAAKRLMGDQASQLSTVVCNSGAYFDVMADNYAKDKATVADIIVKEGGNPTLGMPSIMTDNTALTGVFTDSEETPEDHDVNYTLLLVPGGITITESEDQARMYSQIQLLKSNVQMLLQGEHAYNLDLKGMSWNVGTGGISPSNAALATGANWSAYGTAKDCPGVLIISKA